MTGRHDVATPTAQPDPSVPPGGSVSSCQVCSLKAGHPGVVLDDQGVCNLCNLDFADDLLVNYRYTSEVFTEFQQAPPAAA